LRFCLEAFTPAFRPNRQNGEAIKAVGLLNDTTRDVCDKTANLYEAAGSYPPWMDIWFSKPTR
jgi:hypothetical protein